MIPTFENIRFLTIPQPRDIIVFLLVTCRSRGSHRTDYTFQAILRGVWWWQATASQHGQPIAKYATCLPACRSCGAARNVPVGEGVLDPARDLGQLRREKIRTCSTNSLSGEAELGGMASAGARSCARLAQWYSQHCELSHCCLMQLTGISLASVTSPRAFFVCRHKGCARIATLGYIA